MSRDKNGDISLLLLCGSIIHNYERLVRKKTKIPH
jgi:hypothetical protein